MLAWNTSSSMEHSLFIFSTSCSRTCQGREMAPVQPNRAWMEAFVSFFGGYFWLFYAYDVV